MLPEVTNLKELSKSSEVSERPSPLLYLRELLTGSSFTKDQLSTPSMIELSVMSSARKAQLPSSSTTLKLVRLWSQHSLMPQLPGGSKSKSRSSSPTSPYFFPHSGQWRTLWWTFSVHQDRCPQVSHRGD